MGKALAEALAQEEAQGQHDHRQREVGAYCGPAVGPSPLIPHLHTAEILSSPDIQFVLSTEECTPASAGQPFTSVLGCPSCTLAFSRELGSTSWAETYPHNLSCRHDGAKPAACLCAAGCRRKTCLQRQGAQECTFHCKARRLLNLEAALSTQSPH